MAGEPFIILLVGIEVVENDLEAAAGMGSDDLVHEVEKLLSAPTFLVGGLDPAGCNLKGGEQGRCAVPLGGTAIVLIW